MNKGPNSRCLVRLYCNDESECPDYKSVLPNGYLYLDYAKIVRQGEKKVFLEVHIKDSDGWSYLAKVKINRKDFKN